MTNGVIDVTNADRDSFEREEQEHQEKLSRVVPVACPVKWEPLALSPDGALTEKILDRWKRGYTIHEIAAAIRRAQSFVAGVVNKHEAERAGLGGSYCANVPYTEFLKACASEEEDR